MLVCSDVSVYREDATTPAVKDFSASFQRGAITALSGENGSGKTSLAFVLAGILPRLVHGRWTGDIRLEGVSVNRGWGQDVVGIYAASMPGVELLVGSLGDLLSACDPKIKELADRLPLSSRGGVIRSLSAGQRQLAAWLLAAQRRPEVLVVDEAFASLDGSTARILCEGIRALPWMPSMTVIAVAPVRMSPDLCDDTVTLPSRLRPMNGVGEVRELGMAETPFAASPRPGSSPIAWWSADPGRRYRVPPLRFERGCVVSVIGGIGTGKTTMLKGLGGFPGTRGDATVRQLRRSARFEYVGGPSYEVAGYRTIAEFLAATLDKRLADRLWTVIEPKLRPATLQSDPATLSNGQRHLIALTSRIAGSAAQVICLDEPERGLDPEARALVVGFAAERLARGACFALASHDVDFVSQLSRKATTFVEVEVERV